MRLIDLTGKRFGKLTVLYRNGQNKCGQAIWHCKCDCGREKDIVGTSLRKGLTTSCGCNKGQYQVKDLTGQKIGHLTILERAPNKIRNGRSFVRWKCKCDCGNIIEVDANHLLQHHTTSCGCINSKGELKISSILNDNNIKYKTQYTFNDLRSENGSLLRFDFAILNDDNKLLYLIEYQGKQHYHSSQWDNDLYNLSIRKQYDNQKLQYCKKHKIKLLIIPYWEYKNININMLYNKVDFNE